MKRYESKNGKVYYDVVISQSKYGYHNPRRVSEQFICHLKGGHIQSYSMAGWDAWVIKDRNSNAPNRKYTGKDPLDVKEHLTLKVLRRAVLTLNRVVFVPDSESVKE